MSNVVIEIRGQAHTGKTFLACTIRDLLIAFGVPEDNVKHRQYRIVEPVAKVGRVWPMADRVTKHLNVVIVEKHTHIPIAFEAGDKQPISDYALTVKNSLPTTEFIQDEYDTDVALQAAKINEVVRTLTASINLLPEPIRKGVLKDLREQFAEYGTQNLRQDDSEE